MLLELKDVSFNADTKDILKNVNLCVDKEEFVVITGPNGGGKSTLAKVMMGIEKAETGDILFDGQRINDLNVTERAKLGMGFAFQQPVRFKGLTVKNLLQLASKQELSTEEACIYLSEVGLCAMEYVERELNASLSGGELKRIEIAMLIARGTKLAIFDEPEAGIDLWSFQHLIKVFEKLRDEHSSSVIIISHQERILEIADKIVLIADGEIKEVGSKDKILPLLFSTDSIQCERKGLAI